MEYEFELSSRSLAGLPALQGQYSGVQYGGRVRVQGLTADTAIIKVLQSSRMFALENPSFQSCSEGSDDCFTFFS